MVTTFSFLLDKLNRLIGPSPSNFEHESFQIKFLALASGCPSTKPHQCCRLPRFRDVLSAQGDSRVIRNEGKSFAHLLDVSTVFGMDTILRRCAARNSDREAACLLKRKGQLQHSRFSESRAEDLQTDGQSS